ncbi:MAG: tRNA-intron lyase [Nanoarchaeota archaeon]|nr:tRNA-intron lyase [Nanoarchaeota archaeon]
MVKAKIIKAGFSGDSITSASKEARDLYGNRLFGEYIGKKINYSFVEALYLVEKKKIEVFVNARKLGFNALLEKCKKLDKKIQIKYVVYNDLRNKGYLLKTALKFGADFRVYDKGVRPGKGHARWILYPVSEENEMTWHDFSAKNRVAHSTKKNLLIAVVDVEGGITYYEISWARP